MKGRVWPTVEHYYQAQKFAGTEHEEQVRQAPFPLEAKSLAHDNSRPVRPDWDAVKDGIMQAAVLRKFETHPDLRACCWRPATRNSWRTPPTITTGVAAPTGRAPTPWARS